MAGFPYKQVFVVTLVLFANNFGSLMIFPMLPFMIHDFFPSMAPSQIGNLGGLLASAFYLGGFSGSLMWGRLSDLYGRKPAILAGIVGTTISIILFGTSMNFMWAISSRFLWGFLNGNIGVAKAYLSVTLASEDQPRGFSFLGVSRAAGKLVAPLVGGFLSCPAVKYDSFDNPFFRKFPYFLPCLMGVIICGCCFTATALFLKESRKRKNRIIRKQSSSDNMELVTKEGGMDNQGFVSDREITQPRDVSGDVRTNSDENNEVRDNSERLGLSPVQDFADDKTELLTEDISSTHEWELSSSCERINQAPPEDDDKTDNLHFKNFNYQMRCPFFICCCCMCVASRQSSYRYLEKSRQSLCLGSCRCTSLKVIFGLLKRRTIGILVFMFGMLSFESVLFQEVVPLLLVTDYKHGGFSMDSAEISLILTAIAIAQLLFMIFIYPRIAACLGVRRVLQIGLFATVFAMVLVPFMATFAGDATVVLNNSNNYGSSNFTVIENEPTPTLLKENFKTLTDTTKRRTRIRFDHNNILTPSLNYNLLSPAQTHGKTPILKLSSSRLLSLPYKETFSTTTGGLYLTMKTSVLSTKQEPKYNSKTSLLFTLLGDETSAVYPTKVQKTLCGTCSSSVNGSDTLGQTVTPKTALPDIPVGQCEFDVESGNKTEHLTVSQIPIKVWCVTGVITGVVSALHMTFFTSLNVLIGNSCERHVRGTVYGLTQSAGFLGRFLGPVTGGSIFAWSQRNGLAWPLNYHFLFYCLAAILVVLFVVSTRLPRTLEQQKEEVALNGDYRGNN